MSVNGALSRVLGGANAGERGAGIRLTKQDIEVVRLLAAGLTNRQVAQLLHISSHTVAHRLSMMLRRTGARSRGELIARAYAARILAVGVWPPSATGNSRLLDAPEAVSDGAA